MESKVDLEDLLKRNKIDMKKVDGSVKTLNYYTQNFFDNQTIVPAVHVGKGCRKDTDDVRDITLTSSMYDISSNIKLQVPLFNLVGESSREPKNSINNANDYYLQKAGSFTHTSNFLSNNTQNNSFKKQ
jgi:hypothetical protein